MIGRILRSADFERVLGQPSCARTPHFAVHFLPSGLAVKKNSGSKSGLVGPEQAQQSPPSRLREDAVVEESAPDGIWLGLVVPKRHAKRAVTRTLLKRQMRQSMAHQAERFGDIGSSSNGLAKGMWVVRLRLPFDRKKYPSAASEALRFDATEELSKLLRDAARRVGP